MSNRDIVEKIAREEQRRKRCARMIRPVGTVIGPGSERSRHLIILLLARLPFYKEPRTITRYDLDTGNKVYYSIITFLYASVVPGGGGARQLRNAHDARNRVTLTSYYQCALFHIARTTVTDRCAIKTNFCATYLCANHIFK